MAILVSLKFENLKKSTNQTKLLYNYRENVFLYIPGRGFSYIATYILTKNELKKKFRSKACDFQHNFLEQYQTVSNDPFWQDLF